MTKSVTVKFDDGTSHVYEDVPDDVADSEVEERASTDFGKTIAGVNLPTEAETAKQNYENQSMLEKAAGAAKAGLNLAGQAITHPVGVGLESLAGGKYAIDKLSNAIANRTPGPAVPSAGMQAPVQQTMTGTGQPMRVMPGGQVSGPVVPTQAPVAQPAPQMSAPAAGVKAGSMLDNAGQIVRKLALSKVLPAAQVGAGLFYTSPEEIATLKAAEARKKALGQ